MEIFLLAVFLALAVFGILAYWKTKEQTALVAAWFTIAVIFIITLGVWTEGISSTHVSNPMVNYTSCFSQNTSVTQSVGTYNCTSTIKPATILMQTYKDDSTVRFGLLLAAVAIYLAVSSALNFLNEIKKPVDA